MASRAEELLSQALRGILAELPALADIPDTDTFRGKVLIALHFFLPEVLRELYREWKGESLDGIYPVRAKKVGDEEVELFGVCILISDQTLVPLHLMLQLSATQDEVTWLVLKLGEKLTGEPGETGRRGMKRLDYECLDAALRRVYRLDGNADAIDWVYRVTYGERRST